MGSTLLVNPGSSSKKYALFKDGKEVLRADFEQTGRGFEVCTAINASLQKCEGIERSEFDHTFEAVLALAHREGIFQSSQEIDSVGIRIVAPGTFFQAHRVLDDAYMQALQGVKDRAPLHIPATLYEIETLRKALPHAAFFAVSDSAFHATMPSRARSFALPKDDAHAYDLYRFGYHGISIASVISRVPDVIGSIQKRMIVCHIGSGVSVTALQDGKSIDTSMGYGPGGGMVMGSRAGDMDTDALFALMQASHMRTFDAQMYLQTKGGLRGLWGTSDLRNVLEGVVSKQEDAIEAFEHFLYPIRKTIGGYVAALGGLDALILTATACERNPAFRNMLLEGLETFNLSLDEDKNDACVGRSGLISTDSSIPIAVVHTDEIRQMYRHIEELRGA